MNPSDPQNDTSSEDYKVFLKTLTKVIVCPYCGEPNQLDPPLLCCDEVHAQEAYDDGNEVFTEDELESKFKAWLRDRHDYILFAGKYEKS